MPPHGGHHGGHHHHGGGGGWGAPSWGGWGGWGWYPGSEVVVLTDDSDRDRILAYIASLPEKERAKAFAKFFGKKPLAGLVDELASPRVLLLAGAAVALYFFVLRRKR